MAPASKKRSHSETSSKSQQSRKKHRYSRTDAPSIKLDRVRWKKVSMPDRMDDAEGFYGLEEVEGVDVEVVNGKVEYKLLDPEVEVKEGESVEEELEGFDISGDEKEYEEWTGFGSDKEEEAGEEVGEEAGEEGEEKADEGKTKEEEEPKLNAKQRKALERKAKLEKAKLERKEKKKAAKESSTAAPTSTTSPTDANSNPFSLLENDDSFDIELPAWDHLNLSLPTLRALQKLGFKEPTKIQSASIPKILAGNDLIGKASTGSGKTLAFGIPILEAYITKNEEPTALEGEEEGVKGKKEKKEKKEKLPLALVLAPTRELAHQLRDHLTALSSFAPDFRIATVTGGLSMQKQLRQLENGCDLIIATPGRLWEIVSEGRGWVDKLRRGLKFLVVDEADRLLQEGHFKEVEEVLNLLNKTEEEDSDVEAEPEEGIPEMENVESVEIKKKTKRKQKVVKRQILVFSATFQKELQQKLAGKGKKNWNDGKAGELMGSHESMEWLLKRLNFGDTLPKFVDVNPVSQMAENLKEGIVECGAMEKDLYLYYLLLRYPCRTLVFTNSISSVKRLSPMLNELTLPASPLHSNMIQKARLRNLERFSSPSTPNSILIATDVAARGLDIKGVEMVIHYHVPRTADMYVHRSGRTARAQDRGISVLLCAPEELQGVRRLVQKVHDDASSSTSATRDSRGRYSLKSFNVDRDLAKRLKPRLDLAKKIADSSVERQKKGKEEDWLKNAAEELGVDYDSEEFESRNIGKKGVRGKKKREEAAGVSKGELARWKAELRTLLERKVNAGFSTRYLTSGTVNIAQALVESEGGVGGHENILGVERRRVVDERL